MNPTSSILAAFTFLCGISMLFELTRGTLTARGPWELSLVAVWLVAAAFPENLRLTVVAFSLRIVWCITRLPFTWDSLMLELITDLAVVLHALANDVDGPLGQSMRRTMGSPHRLAWRRRCSMACSSENRGRASPPATRH